MTIAAYKRILLKLSGEALMGDDSYGINRTVVERIVAEIAEVSRLGVQVAIVIGGGNIFRGMTSAEDGMDRATADYMGMLATVMNALALQDAMRRGGLVSRSSRRFGLIRWWNPTFEVKPFVTSKQAKSSFLLPARAIPSLRQIRLPRCAGWK